MMNDETKCLNVVGLLRNYLPHSRVDTRFEIECPFPVS